MRKGIFILLVVFFIVGSIGQIVADDIGFIDMEKLLMKYKGAQKIQQELQKKREEYQKVWEEKQKGIEKARKDKKSDEEIQKMIAKIEEELTPKRNELLHYERDVQMSLLSKIMETAKLVGKEYGIDVVLDKRVVYVGGFDLTDFILEKMDK